MVEILNTGGFAWMDCASCNIEGNSILMKCEIVGILYTQY